ncbi:MAG: Gfo/Idh/MocA family oxidoreductase [Actinomycetota bacterium]|nr:Gfo/Idh/MocA family oxidoreductase [Actinomycetota bacterium]
MIIVDAALAERAARRDPVRVGMVGAGFMGSGIARQIIRSTPGMELVAIANRDPTRARQAYLDAGVDPGQIVDCAERRKLESAVADRRPAITSDAAALCAADGIEAVIEVTGTVEFAATTVLEALSHRKHVVLMNAELDGTIGPVLKHRADVAGVVYTASDGDQPGVQGNLYRFVRGLGLEPLVCGNVKGLHDPYRNPTTQQGFAQRWGQNVNMVTSFADGTKISFEQAIVANATGMHVARRGMVGHVIDGHVRDLTDVYDVDELRQIGGVVDYVVGAEPAPGVFVLAACDDPRQRHYLDLYKLGPGPLYCFYTPYHLCHFEVPASVARAVLFGDAVLAPASGPVVDVVAAAKTDLDAGTVLDGPGGYHTYGLCENSHVARAEGLLPMGLAPGTRLNRALNRDDVVRWQDVAAPAGRLADSLWHEQNERFRPSGPT